MINRVHVVWGMAKDFGLSGMKLGFVITKNDRIKDHITGEKGSWKGASWFSPYDSLKQRIIDPLFNEKDWANKAMDEYKNKLLVDQYTSVKIMLDKKKI